MQNKLILHFFCLQNNIRNFLRVPKLILQCHKRPLIAKKAVRLDVQLRHGPDELLIDATITHSLGKLQRQAAARTWERLLSDIKSSRTSLLLRSNRQGLRSTKRTIPSCT